jgi:TPR repeat protein
VIFAVLPFAVLMIVLGVFLFLLWRRLHHGTFYSRRVMRVIDQAKAGGEGSGPYQLGVAHLHGLDGLPKDENSARFHILEAAAQGNGEAMMQAANMLRYAIGGERDLPEAILWLKRAQACGCPGAERMVGELEAHLQSHGRLER